MAELFFVVFARADQEAGGEAVVLQAIRPQEPRHSQYSCPVHDQIDCMSNSPLKICQYDTFILKLFYNIAVMLTVLKVIQE
jgi:hypothetical protein